MINLKYENIKNFSNKIDLNREGILIEAISKGDKIQHTKYRFPVLELIHYNNEYIIYCYIISNDFDDNWNSSPKRIKLDMLTYTEKDFDTTLRLFLHKINYLQKLTNTKYKFREGKTLNNYELRNRTI